MMYVKVNHKGPYISVFSLSIERKLFFQIMKVLNTLFKNTPVVISKLSLLFLNQPIFTQGRNSSR